MHWPLCATAIYAVAEDEFWDVLGPGVPMDIQEAPGSGRAEWSKLIEFDRQSLLYQLKNLLIEGQRDSLQSMVSYYADLSDTEARDLLDDIGNDPDINETERKERVWQLKAVREDRSAIQSVNFLSWDLVRFINLCRTGAAAGLIDCEEAFDFSLTASHHLQRAFNSWDACTDHFLRAREFWRASDGLQTFSDNMKFEVARRRLSTAVNSPWQLVPWRMTLPPSNWLFVDALIDVVLTPILDEGSREGVDYIALEIDAVARRKLDKLTASGSTHGAQDSRRDASASNPPSAETSPASRANLPMEHGDVD